MSQSVPKIYFSHNEPQIYNERIVFHLDEGEIEKISLPYLQEDTFETNNNKIKEIKTKSLTHYFFRISQGKVSYKELILHLL